MSRRRPHHNAGHPTWTQSIIAPGFCPSGAYGDYARVDTTDKNHQIRKAAASSRNARKAPPITLATVPFDHRSDD